MHAFFLLLLLGLTHTARVDINSVLTGNNAYLTHKAPEQDFVDDDKEVLYHWAVVVAGSNGWWNYRHQADVCHAYQVLRRGGLLAERIVVMMYDDIAHYRDNPNYGTVINRPGGPDVYKGVVADYRGDDVTAANFLAVLRGDEDAMRGVGSGKVVLSGPQDRVFVFYSDHGSPGVLALPAGPYLYADQLAAAIRAKREAGGYREMVMYMEACESGSMFEGVLGGDLGVYVATASDPEESSWGTYCPGMTPGSDPGYDTCLGDLFSVAWMEASEWQDLGAVSLQEQFELVQKRTSNNGTYNMGSHAMQYGQLLITSQRAGSYIGMNNRGWPTEPITPSTPTPSLSPTAALVTAAKSALAWLTGGAKRMAPTHPLGAWLEPQTLAQAPSHSLPELGASGTHMEGSLRGMDRVVSQRDADLEPLKHRVRRAKGEAQRREAQAALDAALAQRAAVDGAATSLAARLLMGRATGAALMTGLGWVRPQVFAPEPGSPSNQLRPSQAYVAQLVGGSMGRPGSGKALVDDWECLRGMVGAWEGACGVMDQYAIKHTRLFANLCNAGVEPAAVAEVMRGVCKGSGGGSSSSSSSSVAAQTSL